MGGMQTRTIAPANLDKFSAIGLFSGGSINADSITNMDEFKNKVKLVFVGYGSKELGGNRGMGGDPKAATEGLKTVGVNAHFYVSQNTAHEWQSWRRCLYQMAPLLFRDKPPVDKGLVSTQVPPIASASDVLKDVFQDSFRIGVAVNRSVTTGQAFRRSVEDVASDVALVKKHFNHVVAENDMKWQLIHPRPGADGYDFAPADALVEFAKSNQMEIAGHTLVWHSQTPNWVFEGTHQASDSSSTVSGPFSELTINPPRAPGGNPNSVPGQAGPNQSAPGQGRPGRGAGGPGFGGFRGFDLNGPRTTREELLARMREHIHAVVGRYKGKVKVWDVVNEALSDSGPEVLRRSPWSVIIGPDFIAKAFEYAHEADPDAILRYNDYSLENAAKRSKLMTLVRSLQTQKVPIHAIGSQAHCNVATTFESMDQALTEMKSLGLPIHITELDVNSAAAGQRGTGADIGSNAAATQGYAGIFRAFIKHREAIDIVTFWGVNDAVSWRAQGKPLLFDGSNIPKPAFDAIVELKIVQ